MVLHGYNSSEIVSDDPKWSKGSQIIPKCQKMFSTGPKKSRMVPTDVFLTALLLKHNKNKLSQIKPLVQTLISRQRQGASYQSSYCPTPSLSLGLGTSTRIPVQSVKSGQPPEEVHSSTALPPRQTVQEPHS